MKYYSEKLDKFFENEKDLIDEEIKFDAEHNEIQNLYKEKELELKNLYDEYILLKKKLDDINRQYIDKTLDFNNFCKRYHKELNIKYVSIPLNVYW